MHSFIDRVTNQRPASGTSHQLTMPKRFQLNVPVIQTILAPYQLSPYAVNSLASSLHRTQCHHSSTASVRTLVIIGQARKVGYRIKSSSFSAILQQPSHLHYRQPSPSLCDVIPQVSRLFGYCFRCGEQRLRLHHPSGPLRLRRLS